MEQNRNKNKISKKEKYIAVASIICIIITIISVYYHIASYEPNGVSHYDWTHIDLNQTKIDGGYILRIHWKTHHKFLPKNLIWYIDIQNEVENIAYNSFPIISGNSGSTSDNNITVTWFDNDLNKELSINDTIKIYAPQHNLSKIIFSIAQRIYDNGSTKRLDLLCQIHLN